MSRLRTRLPRLLSVWLTTGAAELVLRYFFLSRPYYRGFVAPFAAAVLAGGAPGIMAGVAAAERG